MTLLDTGLNEIRTMIGADLSTGILGSGLTAVSSTDTALASPDASTSVTLSKTYADKQITLSYTLPSTSGNSVLYSEFGLRNADPTYYDRVRFTGLQYYPNGTTELSLIKRYFVRSV